MKISIILPIYNGEEYLLEQLMSIYNQTISNWELVIINDGSTDNSINIINKFIKDFKLQNKIKILENPRNLGLNKTIESGLKFLKTNKNTDNHFIAYCDADDIWVRNKLETNINYITKNNYDLIYSDLSTINQYGEVITRSYRKTLHSCIINPNKETFNEFLFGNHVTATSIMFKAKYIDILLPFPDILYQDWRTVLLFSFYNLKIGFINMSLILYYYYCSN